MARHLSPVPVLKRTVRRRIGIWRAMEWRNQVVLGPAVPRARRFEDAEVARLGRQLGQVPAATVACIVPTYRRPAGVAAAVRSVLAQQHRDLVVVVVDDGGGGLGSLPVDPRLHAVSLSRNWGVAGVVRNVGVRLTRSSYVAYLDDDNTWEPDHLGQALQALHAGADLAYTDVGRYRPDGTLLDTLSHDFDRRRLADEAYIDTNAIVVRRSRRVLWSRLPRTRDTLPMEDWEYVFRLSRGAAVTHVPRTTVRYLVNPDSYYTRWATDPDAHP